MRFIYLIIITSIISCDSNEPRYPVDYFKKGNSTIISQVIVEQNKKIDDYIFKNKENSYLNSKLKLPVVTKKMKEKFGEENQIRTFLEKGIFRNDEVDKLVVKEEKNFLIFDKKDVLDIFEESLEAKNSIAGRRIDDINIGGQKTILKHKTNICELEIRNDSIEHYRQVRFNMKRKKALILLNQKCTERHLIAPKVKYCKKT